MYGAKKQFKRCIAKIVLFFFYRGFRSAFGLDSEIKNEIKSWGNDFHIMMSTEEGGPSICFGLESGTIKRFADCDGHGIFISFKSIDTAFLVLTGQLSIVDSYIRHGIIVKGNISTAMSLIRCADKVESYLFPDFMLKSLLDYRPQREVTKLRMYLKVLTGI